MSSFILRAKAVATKFKFGIELILYLIFPGLMALFFLYDRNSHKEDPQ